MEELINLVQQKTGLPPDKARMAVDTVLGFLKQRLPAPIAGQIDSAISGKSGVGDIAGAVGGLFGDKK